MKNYVAYYRVSTQKQGQSGIGLEAQKRTVEQFCREGDILSEFTDVESGKNISRPELMKAIVHAKKHQALLVIAKLDRLSRNIFFISSLLESKVHFKACDLPEADHFTVHLFAALAEKERKMNSERTKSALESKKAQGFLLGNPKNLTQAAQLKGIEAVRTNALTNEHNIKAGEMARLLKREGASLRHIAQRLNQLGYATRYGKSFHATSVKRLLESQMGQLQAQIQHAATLLLMFCYIYY
ncbi:resolvase, N-terminal [Flammeovirgaceae bacterium 311]|nr:resolvase, N-terminal [Flammeovirgaceae bacterium 311]